MTDNLFFEIVYRVTPKENSSDTSQYYDFDWDKIVANQPEKLKILWANESSVISGPVNKLIHTAPILTNQCHHDLTILLPDYDQGKLGTLGSAKIIETGYIPISNFQLSIFHPPNRFKNILKKGQFDIVHVSTPMRGPFGLFFLGGSVIDMASKRNLPIVAGAQTFNLDTAKSMIPKALKFTSPLIESFVKRQESRMHSKATINFSPSVAMDNYILSRKGVNSNTLVRLENGVDPIYNRQRRNKESAKRQKHQWAITDQLVVLVPGRLAAEKSLDRLKAIKDLQNIKIVFVGDGPERSKLEKAFPDAIFTGMLRGEELADAYANGDILVLTSEAETYSQVLFEGLASSLPVVVPNKGAFVDLVKHGQFGYKYNNDDSLISYVNKLVKDTALRDQMGKVAMSVASNKTWQKETEKLIKMYRLAIYLNQQANPKHKLEQISIASLNLK